MDHLRALLPTLEPSCGPVRVIAVDGPSAAGKSTFAGRLARELGAPLIGSDDFPLPWDAKPLSWWPNAALILKELEQGRTAILKPYHWQTATYGEPRRIPPAPIVVLEGVGAAWQGCPAAYRIWVDAPYEVRRLRALDRDGEEYLPAWESWALKEDEHYAADQTRAHADLVIDSSQ